VAARSIQILLAEKVMVVQIFARVSITRDGSFVSESSIYLHRLVPGLVIEVVGYAGGAAAAGEAAGVWRQVNRISDESAA
jgi:hypothetical protein